MFEKRTVRDVELYGKKVLVRVDFNVPLKDGRVLDDTRIIAAIPTIEYLISSGSSVILMSHLGRPGGTKVDEFSLKPVAEYLDRMIDPPVVFVENCLGKKAENAAKQLKPGTVLLLENTRFHPGETKNDPKMGKELSALADLYVNDAFGTSHRSHASNVGVAEHLPSVAGLLLEKEIQYLGKTITNPERPFSAILGGAKVSGKIEVIRNLTKKVDHILVGGGMANTFFAAQGYKMGESLVEEDAINLAHDLLDEAGKKMHLPVDVVIADDFSETAQTQVISVHDIPEGWRIMDIGPDTMQVFSGIIKKSKTIVWNGPMGVFELGPFSTGTFELANMVADSKAVSIIGGGDSASAVQQAGLSDQITHISTGGGASLKMLEGSVLPGLAVLDEK